MIVVVKEAINAILNIGIEAIKRLLQLINGNDICSDPIGPSGKQVSKVQFVPWPTNTNADVESEKESPIEEYCDDSELEEIEYENKISKPRSREEKEYTEGAENDQNDSDYCSKDGNDCSYSSSDDFSGYASDGDSNGGVITRHTTVVSQVSILSIYMHYRWNLIKLKPGCGCYLYWRLEWAGYNHRWSRLSSRKLSCHRNTQGIHIVLNSMITKPMTVLYARVRARQW